MRIEMISTGDEIMTGFVTDTNTGFFASRLLDSGQDILESETAWTS